jgi:hypothetical protein
MLFFAHSAQNLGGGRVTGVVTVSEMPKAIMGVKYLWMSKT